MSQPFILFGKPSIGSDEKNAVLSVLDSAWLSTGKVVKQFEEEFEKFVGAHHAVAVSSCTDGITLSLLTRGIGYGDEVITSPLTFAATVNSILAVGAKPVFVDVNVSGHLDAYAIEAAITSNTKAIIPVHYTGSFCEMEKIMDIAARHDLVVIEDAAHAFGGFYVERNGTKRNAGSIGDFTCFSFYANKNITCGEGGMVMVRDGEDAKRLRILSTQGMSADAYKRYGNELVGYSVVEVGRKSNLSDVHAAIGLAQLRRWPDLKEARRAVWNEYQKAFQVNTEYGHAMHLFTILRTHRDKLRKYLHEKGIGSGIHFKPLHLESAYKFLGYRKGEFPIAERIGETTLSLPLSSTMDVFDAKRVIEEVNTFGEGE